ncbi:MAG: aldo/keto reductase [Bacteroidales bacterium]|nr:aldo/keto reductase [Bacteroidales bacterium]
MNQLTKLVMAILLLFTTNHIVMAQKTKSENIPYATLNNGCRMPLFGIGTFGVPGDSIAADAVSFALKNGYRHIDTAHAYYVERGVGKGIKDSGIPREDIWLTSKLWPSEYGEEASAKAIDRMLERLGVDYIDLLYVHQPVGDWKGAWRAMEKAVAEGKVKSLGLSNFDFSDSLYNEAISWAKIKSAVMQIECHPYAQRSHWAERLSKDGIQLECWFPLGGAMSNGALFKDPVIKKIAEKHGKTPAQIILRWHIQEGHSAIPGATDHGYIKENISIFDFELTPEEMNKMRSLNKEQRFYTADLEHTRKFVSGLKLND